jgi:uncharacterized membrane protein YphA (DoxX/SURF4 family)
VISKLLAWKASKPLPVGETQIPSNNDDSPAAPSFFLSGELVSRSSFCISGLAAAAIVLLRVGIGVHFLAEGWTKLEHPKPFSGGFFGNAKGPLAPLYKNLVWDPDGVYRLDLEGTLTDWDTYRNKIVNHYGFDDKQQKAAADTLKRYEARLKQFQASKSETIEEYRLWLERRDKNATDPARKLASLQTHDARIAGETRKLYGELIPTIDRLWKDLENDLNAIATEEQWSRHGRLAISKPGRTPIDSESMDRIVPWFDVAVGACLILGLLTRPAAILGALFLASVCASQWPLAPGAMPIYNQAIEMLALLALAAIGAGRFVGLDYFLGGLRNVCCPPKSRPLPPEGA